MKDQDDVRYVVIERRNGGVSAFLGGAILGAVAALLLAPRSGKETRQEIREGVRRVRDTAEDTIRQMQERFGEAMEEVRRQIDERVESAREALDAGRAAARQTRAEMEARIRDAKAGLHAAADAVAHGSKSDGPSQGSESNPD
ncbi:MAG TPA: YtxH domain-containing protein [Longimicrobiales bacterium]|nr:YtxH domain-containing protein [Longimicrobiales bacterium]